jgi:hypothetical protein
VRASVHDKKKHPNRIPDLRIVDRILPEHVVNVVRDNEPGPFPFVEKCADGVQVNHLALTYKF